MPERKRKPAPRDSGAGVLLLVFGILIGLALVVRLFIGGSAPEKPQSEQIEVTVTEEKTSFWEKLFGKEEPEETEPALPTETQPYPVSTATLGAMGDMLMHIQLISGKYNSIADLGDGNYDFSPIFKHLGDSVSGLDYAVANLETTFGGDRHPYQGNPTFNCPDQLAGNLKDAGFDMLLTVNNHCSDTLNAGIKRTLNTVRQAGLTTLGTRLTADEQRYTIAEVNGIRIGMVCYSYTMKMVDGVPSLNGGLPLEEPELVNWFTYEDLPGFYSQIESVQKNMRSSGADATVVFIHWGEEYQLTENGQQHAIGQKLCDIGFDVIVGGHPHVVQPVDLLTSTENPDHKTVCLYSMGNAISNQRLGNISYVKTSHTEDGVLFSVTFCKYSDGSVYLLSTDILPTWVHLDQTKSPSSYIIIPLDDSRSDEWQELYSLTDAVYEKAMRSYDRTMAIVGDGLAECQNYLEAEGMKRDWEYLAAVNPEAAGDPPTQPTEATEVPDAA